MDDTIIALYRFYLIILSDERCGVEFIYIYKHCLESENSTKSINLMTCCLALSPFHFCICQPSRIAHNVVVEEIIMQGCLAQVYCVVLYLVIVSTVESYHHILVILNLILRINSICLINFGFSGRTTFHFGGTSRHPGQIALSSYW